MREWKRWGLRCHLVVTVLLLSWGAAQAQACKHPLPQFDVAHWQKEAKSAQDKGLLWRLEKDGRTSWLLATVHVNTPSEAMLGPRVTQAMLNSDVVAVELDVLNPVQVSQLMDKVKAEMPPLTPATRMAVQQVLADGCHPSAAKPEEIGRMLLLPSLLTSHLRSHGLFAEYGADVFTLGMAQGMKKPVRSLETPDMQAQAMVLMQEGGSYDAKVMETIAGLASDKVGKQVLRMHDVWLKGDADALQNYAQWCDCQNTQAEKRFIQAMTDARNPGMAQGIAQLHDQGQRVFAAIGMLHMTGPKAVQTLLTQAGFQVTYMPLK
jgi:uncharacterized protein